MTIEVDQLVKYYDSFTAVDHVSFRIPSGQIVSLLGPNGGKSTILRILTGYLSPSGGRASVLGHSVQHERLAVATAIGYLPENGPLYPDMTPLESLQLFGEARGLRGPGSTCFDLAILLQTEKSR